MGAAEGRVRNQHCLTCVHPGQPISRCEWQVSVWKVGEAATRVTPTFLASQTGLLSLIKLLPAALKEAAHDMPSLAHFRVVLVEGLAVVKNQQGISGELL